MNSIVFLDIIQGNLRTPLEEEVEEGWTGEVLVEVVKVVAVVLER